LVRFKNYSAGAFYPNTVVTVSDSWGAYHIGPKPEERDILHLYADNALFIETDLGEQSEMTLEDGRRHLFWNKDYQTLSEWAAERKPVPCQLPGSPDASLINTGVSLSTTIQPDNIGNSPALRFNLTGPVGGGFTVGGTIDAAATLITERATSLTPPMVWEAVQTNSVASGVFSFVIPQGASPAAYFRLRQAE
jgi:hypothetical protein